MEYYLAIEKGNSHLGQYSDTVLRKIIQIEKDKYYMILLKCEISKGQTFKNSRMMVASGWGRSG